MRKRETPKQAKIHKVMSEHKRGQLHSGSKSGPVVKDRKQAVAIALAEGRKAGGGKKARERRLADKGI
jgi:hypothetical protein